MYLTVPFASGGLSGFGWPDSWDLEETDAVGRPDKGPALVREGEERARAAPPRCASLRGARRQDRARPDRKIPRREDEDRRREGQAARSTSREPPAYLRTFPCRTPALTRPTPGMKRRPQTRALAKTVSLPELEPSTATAGRRRTIPNPAGHAGH
jgi:hypothetical protein